jgi:hypothetical protein
LLGNAQKIMIASHEDSTQFYGACKLLLVRGMEQPLVCGENHVDPAAPDARNDSAVHALVEIERKRQCRSRNVRPSG